MKRIATLLLLVLAPLVHAATVFDNGVPDLADGALSDLNSSARAFDDFTLGGSTTLQSVQWWGIYIFSTTPAADSFNIDFYADNAGAPGASIAGPYSVAVTRQSTPDLVFSTYALYQYTASIPNTVLGAGTYWMSIQNDTTGQAYNWYWASSAHTPANGLADGTPLGFDLAFNLSGTSNVPEPATYLLSAAGLAGIFLARRRRA